MKKLSVIPQELKFMDVKYCRKRSDFGGILKKITVELDFSLKKLNVFHSPDANERCRRESPQLRPVDGRTVACHAVEEGRI